MLVTAKQRLLLLLMVWGMFGCGDGGGGIAIDARRAIDASAGPADARLGGAPDAPLNSSPDAAPAPPDAPRASADAPPAQPDAAPASSDAPPGQPDAAAGQPDARQGVTCPGAVWAKGYDTPLAGGEALDPAGNLYVAGTFFTTIDFGSGPISTAGSADIYVVKLDPATGLAMWSIRAGDDQDQDGDNITVDRAGHLAVIGRYIGTLTFGGVPPLTSATDSVYVAGFDAATGLALWAKNINLGGGALLGIATDPIDNGVVVTGFTGANAVADFGAGPLGTSGGGQDIVVGKLNATTGAVVWARQIGGALDQVPNAVAVDAGGRVFVTGQYAGDLDFGNGALPTIPNAARSIFVGRIDGALGGGQAARGIGTAGRQASTSIAIDPNGNAIIAGSMQGTLDFGTGSPLVSAGVQDVFAAKLSPDLASTVWARRFGDTMLQRANGVAVGGSGNVVVTGLFQGSMDFASVGTLTSSGNFDAFVATLDAATGAPTCAAAATDATGSDQSSLRILIDPANGSQYLIGTYLGSINWDNTGALPQVPGSTSSNTYFVKRH